MPSDDVFDFQCPACQHRLKARIAAVGRRAKCPKCQQSLTVPAVPAAKNSPPDQAAAIKASAARPANSAPSVAPARPPVPTPGAPATPPQASSVPSVKVTATPSTIPPPTKVPSIDHEDWLNLGEPAITDLSDRQRLYEANKEAKEQERRAKQNRHQSRLNSSTNSDANSQQNSGQPTSAKARGNNHAAAQAAQAEEIDDLEDVFRLAPLSTADPRTESAQSKSPTTSESDGRRSVFDDDLPELSELQPSGKSKRKTDDLLASLAGEDMSTADPLGPLVPDLQSLPKGKAKPRAASQLPDDPEYRISCEACGTAQYVRLSQKGKMIKCPDCYLKFEIPAPMAGWQPDPKAQQRAKENDWHSSRGDTLQAADPQDSQRSRASRLIERAEQQASDEELDSLYDSDFDTANFVQRTFGFLKDPVAIAYMFGYAIVFAGIFAAAQYAANQAETEHGKGILLAVVIGAPVVGLLFAMPMLSGGIALLESVANRQQRVADWPGFNLFDNAGDMLAISAALLGAVIPGFLLGTWLGGEDAGAGRIQIAGMMSTCFILFPVFLLSMLDNGSLFAPLSNSILRSFRDAAEAWGGYFLKTFIAFSTVMLLWLLLLGEGKPIALAAIGGCLLPPLVFFTCQQIGALADSISEHLSFEFVPPSDDADDEVSPASNVAPRGKLNG